jgi:hypothetical protein
MDRRLAAGCGLTSMAMLLALAGCAQQREAPPERSGIESAAASRSASEGQTLAIDYSGNPDPPRAGDNRLRVIVKRPDGSAVTDATVTAVFSMPPMPAMNMPAMTTTTILEHETDGQYRGNAQLSMGGTWYVTIAVSRGAEELGSRKFSVVAK